MVILKSTLPFGISGENFVSTRNNDKLNKSGISVNTGCTSEYLTKIFFDS